MDVIGHAERFVSQDFKTVLCRYLSKQLFEPCGNRFNQDFLAIAWNPNKVVVDYVDAVGTPTLACGASVVFSILIHGTILLQKGEGAFLHPLEVGRGASRA